MTIFRKGKPYTPPKPRGEPPASGFALWTWAAGNDITPAQAADMVEAYREAHPAIADPWRQLTPEEIVAAVRRVAGDELTDMLLRGTPYGAR